MEISLNLEKIQICVNVSISLLLDLLNFRGFPWIWVKNQIIHGTSTEIYMALPPSCVNPLWPTMIMLNVVG